jgi:glycosyltransferase involved in cell wall biosynthesis
VIASRTGGIPEHLQDGKEGYLFAPGDVDELERLVRRLAGRPDLVERLRPRGDDVPTLYENAMDVEEVYRRVLRQWHRSRDGS